MAKSIRPERRPPQNAREFCILKSAKLYQNILKKLLLITKLNKLCLYLFKCINKGKLISFKIYINIFKIYINLFKVNINTYYMN